ncbi:MAG: helix-turn-helix domain-containing protein [Fimbriimonadales bacterium]
MMNAGQRLRELRKERGLPIAVLARKARVGLQTLSNAERWGLPLPYKSAERIAQVLGVPVEELLDEPQGEVSES